MIQETDYENRRTVAVQGLAVAKVTAVSSLGWAHYTLYEILPRMKALGFKRMEIASFGSYSFHFNFGSPTPPELVGMLKATGLTPINLNFSHGIYWAYVPEDIDRFVADWSRKLPHLVEAGIPMMTMPFGWRNERPDQEFQLANAVRAFDRVGDIAKKMGIRMLMEAPHLYSIINRPHHVEWVLERLSTDNVGVLVDSSHWGIINYEPEVFFKALGSRLWHVHLRDATGPDTADGNQELELTPGKGTADFAKFGQALDTVGYKGDVSLEFEYRDSTFEDIDKEFRDGVAHLAKTGWKLPETVKV
ncbi:MAG: sugar phosphate isomerase/epimerase [SAR202 cluster bacterium]|nr:sugar phosphate isomerase/epimerase [SAR202 cluster bacterium]